MSVVHRVISRNPKAIRLNEHSVRGNNNLTDMWTRGAIDYSVMFENVVLHIKRVV